MGDTINSYRVLVANLKARYRLTHSEDEGMILKITLKERNMTVWLDITGAGHSPAAHCCGEHDNEP
jgi:hypothetical protein